MKIENKKYRIFEYSFLVILFLIIHYLINLPYFKFLGEYLPTFQKLSMSIALIFFVILLGKIIEKIIDTQVHNDGDQYNLLRITRLLTLIFVLIVVASFLSQNLYGVVASIGLISLILGFALQAPITSFIAWLYIIFRRPYQVGNRIQIEGYKGDVIEINYLDTIIEEVGGNYLENDRQSGRLIYFPNSLILKAEIINYSGKFTPFIWNETAIQVSYTSDLKFIEACLLEAAIKDFTEVYPKRSVKKNEPAVYFRVNTYAWMEAVISYPVEPYDTTGRRNRILRYALPLLNAQPGKVGFPEGTQR